MRNLQTRDIFAAARLIKDLKLKDTIKELTTQVDKGQDVKDIGIDMAMGVFEKCTDKESEKRVYEFLAGPLEVTAEEVEKMDLVEIIENITKIADIEKWKLFLSQASKLMK